jgi:hypothetical protein
MWKGLQLVFYVNVGVLVNELLPAIWGLLQERKAGKEKPTI